LERNGAMTFRLKSNRLVSLRALCENMLTYSSLYSLKLH
jgi:hypothetical protein